MVEKIEVKSNFLETYLSEFSQIHFLGNKDESSLYIKVDDLNEFKDSELFFWVEFLQTNYAPVIVLYLKLIKGNDEFIFDFIYDIKEENDLLELEDIIKHIEANVNVMEIDDDILFFGYTFKLNLDESFGEELKRIIFQAQEYSRTMIDSYDINFAIDEFLDGNSIFKSRTNIIENFELLFPQENNEESDSNSDEDSIEEGFFTYKSNASGNFHDEGENLQVKVYKRNEYEKIKNKKFDDKPKSEGSNDVLNNRIRQLEIIIKSKNKEIEKLKTENIHLKEELEYQKLDSPKKGWKLF